MRRSREQQVTNPEERVAPRNESVDTRCGVLVCP